MTTVKGKSRRGEEERGRGRERKRGRAVKGLTKLGSGERRERQRAKGRRFIGGERERERAKERRIDFLKAGACSLARSGGKHAHASW